MNRNALRERWDGPRWYLWALLAGIMMIVATAGVAALLAAVLGQNMIPLLALGLIIELLIVSLIGSGMLESLSRRVRRDGLTDRASDAGMEDGLPGDRTELDTEAGDEEDDADDREREKQERVTLRMGLMALPLLALFLALLLN